MKNSTFSFKIRASLLNSSSWEWMQSAAKVQHETLYKSHGDVQLHSSHHIYYRLDLKSYWRPICVMNVCDIMNICCLQPFYNNDWKAWKWGRKTAVCNQNVKKLWAGWLYIYQLFFLTLKLFVSCPWMFGEFSAILFILCQISSTQPVGPRWYTDAVFVQILLFTARSLN